MKTDPNTVINYSNNCKFIGFVIKIEFKCYRSKVLKFSEKFDHLFPHVFIFGNMFPESHGFDAVPVTRSNNFVSLH